MAVDGVVVSTDGDQVTLDVSHWYTGDATDRVVVTAPSVDLMPLLGSVDLEKGERYLLAGQDGTADRLWLQRRLRRQARRPLRQGVHQVTAG